MWDLIKKDTLVLSKNWVTYFLTLIVPVMSVLINLVIMQTANVKLDITVIEDEPRLAGVLSAMLEGREGLTFSIAAGDDTESAVEAVRNKKTSVAVEADGGGRVTIYYDETRQDSLVAFQLVSGYIQKATADDLKANHPELMESVEARQLFRIGESKNVGTMSAKASAYGVLIAYGLIWVFVFTPLNHAIGQIQQERSAGSLFYSYKIPVRKAAILLSKQTAIILQCFLSLAIFIALSGVCGVFNVRLLPVYFPVAVLIVLSMSSIGYFLGFLLKDQGSAMIITFLLTIPTMLISSFNTVTAVDPVMKCLPTYYAAMLIKEMVSGSGITISYVLANLLFAVVFFAAACVLFIRKDPVKLCRNM